MAKNCRILGLGVKPNPNKPSHNNNNDKPTIQTPQTTLLHLSPVQLQTPWFSLQLQQMKEASDSIEPSKPLAEGSFPWLASARACFSAVA